MTVRLQYLINEDTPHGKYQDALYFNSQEELDAADIPALVQARVDGWVYAMEHPATPLPATPGDLARFGKRLREEMEKELAPKIFQEPYLSDPSLDFLRAQVLATKAALEALESEE